MNTVKAARLYVSQAMCVHIVLAPRALNVRGVQAYKC